MPVHAKSNQMTEVEGDLELVDALWGGTRTMRKAGEQYLPREPKEKPADYKVRLRRSTLTNLFRKTITSMAGKVAEDQITVTDDAEAEKFAENVDLQGRDLHRFAYSASKKALKDGVMLILIDAPAAEGVDTLEEERDAGIRPFWVEIDRGNILGWVEKDGFLLQLRVMESVDDVVDEFSFKPVDQIRVIEPGLVRIFRKNEKGDWVLHTAIETSVPFVPIVPVYASQDGFLVSPPPFMDLAHLNVEHWQKSSDQSNILHVVRVPILFGAGIRGGVDDDGKQVVIEAGPNSFVQTDVSTATLTYVEHSGAGIGAGRQDIMDIEDRAAAMGASFISKKKAGSVTATERAIDEAGENSELSNFALGLKDSLELAMAITAQMTGGEFTGQVTVNTDYGLTSSTLSAEDLLKMRASREISRETYFRLLNEITGFEINASDEGERLDDEGPEEVDNL